METMFDDLEYNGHNGDLVVEFEPIFEIEEFDAHDISGALKTFKRQVLKGVKVLGATFFKIDQDGGEYGQYDWSDDDALGEFDWLEESLIDKIERSL